MEKDSRLNEYYIQYSDDGSNWKDYTYEGQRKARLVGLGIFFFHDIHHFEISWFCTHETNLKLNMARILVLAILLHLSPPFYTTHALI